MSYRPIVDYLPHRPPMVLLDRVVEITGTCAVCEVTIRVDSPFCDGCAVPGWVGIEYMAQTVGVLAGWQAQAKQLPVKVGFLAGTRHYQSHVSQFRVGDVLRITADEEMMSADSLSAMRCMLHDAASTLLAEASLLVFQPDNLEASLQQASTLPENASALQ
ncbi:MAG: 3-hydroxylacyl-ACP dehydratase [Betaproteobacteria bacterium]|nr:3-hydroxylacyl-ACP dehydratase [Betaproteobacteria bacterium]